MASSNSATAIKTSGTTQRGAQPCKIVAVILLSCLALAWIFDLQLLNEPMTGVATTQLRQREKSGKLGTWRVVPNANQAFLDDALRQASIDFVVSSAECVLSRGTKCD